MNEQLEANSEPKPNFSEERYHLINYLVKRLEHTITHTQTATKLIYLVNGAILAAVYFEFGRIQPISAAFLVGGVLTLLLCIVNLLHANFMTIQNAWYRTIDQEIRSVFMSFANIEKLWPKHLGERLDEVLETYDTNYPMFRFKRTSKIYVWLHLILAFFLFIFSIAFFVMWWMPPNIKIVT